TPPDPRSKQTRDPLHVTRSRLCRMRSPLARLQLNLTEPAGAAGTRSSCEWQKVQMRAREPWKEAYRLDQSWRAAIGTHRAWSSPPCTALTWAEIGFARHPASYSLTANR